MYEDIEAVLDEHVRPLLRTHGGEMEIIEVEDGVVRFKLKGKCAGCPAADLTTEELIFILAQQRTRRKGNVSIIEQEKRNKKD